MKKVFRWTLLSLAVCGTFVVFASNATNRIQDVRPPIVRVSPSEAVVDPYIEFMMTISFRYARNIVIAPSNSSVYVYDIDDADEYISDVRHFNYYSVINAPNISVRYIITASNYDHSEEVVAYYSSTDMAI